LPIAWLRHEAVYPVQNVQPPVRPASAANGIKQASPQHGVFLKHAHIAAHCNSGGDFCKLSLAVSAIIRPM
jgi:hypothetical protein